jgi:hypothetical protein
MLIELERTVGGQNLRARECPPEPGLDNHPIRWVVFYDQHVHSKKSSRMTSRCSMP